jgi:ribonuclease R
MMILQLLKDKIKNYMEQESYSPLNAEDLIGSLKLGGTNLKAFWQALEELEKEGVIVKTRFQTYGMPKKMGLVSGRLQMTAKGFGFVLGAKDSGDKDLFVAPSDLNGAMHNDIVIARVSAVKSGENPEGKIIRIIEHANTKVVGTFVPSGDYAFVVPDDKRLGCDIYIPRKDFNGAKAKQKVVAQITVWPVDRRNAEGKVVEILGNIGDVGLEIISIIKQNDLPLQFPPEVLAAAKKVPSTIKTTEIAQRQDRRDKTIITVDGEDAKDLDDAVYVEKQGRDYFLGVYIADVSYYVKENSVIDKEALDRGTSVYLVDRVLPMLPETLSNGICSLNEGVDRLTMACEMLIDGATGNVKSYRIFPSIIRSHHRMTYTAIRQMLVDKDPEVCTQYKDILPMVKNMEKLCLILKKKRMDRGAIDFDLAEQKVILDDQKKPIAIVPRERTIAESVIEEFMLAANETVAQHMAKAKWPFIYRVHDFPDLDRMESLSRLLATFGVVLRAQEKMEPMVLQKALAEMKGKPEEKLISTVALRSLKQAVYQTENVGHFGLAAEFYTHFTSPIRRYPDLMVHRLLRKWLLDPEMNKAKAAELEFNLENIATHSSVKERAAAEAERATVELKEAEYMAGFIGQEFSGTISGVTSFGIFVTLENGVDGLIHISSLTDDYYDFEEDKYALVGFHLHKTYRLGDEIKVEVLQVNIPEHQVDLVLAGENPETKQYLKAQLQEKNNVLGSKTKSHGAYFSSLKSHGGKDSKKHRPRNGKKNTKAKGRKKRERRKY